MENLDLADFDKYVCFSCSNVLNQKVCVHYIFKQSHDATFFVPGAAAPRGEGVFSKYFDKKLVLFQSILKKYPPGPGPRAPARAGTATPRGELKGAGGGEEAPPAGGHHFGEHREEESHYKEDSPGESHVGGAVVGGPQKSHRGAPR